MLLRRRPLRRRSFALCGSRLRHLRLDLFDVGVELVHGGLLSLDGVGDRLEELLDLAHFGVQDFDLAVHGGDLLLECGVLGLERGDLVLHFLLAWAARHAHAQSEKSGDGGCGSDELRVLRAHGRVLLVGPMQGLQGRVMIQ